MTRPPGVTVLLPTHRRPGPLARALAGVAAQADPGVPWELVVVVNDPDGAAERRIVEAARVPVPTRTVVEPRLGSAHARNRGIEEAGASVVAMLDDDVVPDRRWLATLVEPILAGRCDGAGGAVVLDPAVRRPAWFDEAGVGGYLTSFRPATEERPLAAGEFVVTANAAFDTGLLRRSGGFDPRLGPRGRVPLVGDDVLLSRRFLAAGGRISHVPDAVVVHELPAERLTPRYLLRRAWAQGRSDWILDRDVLSRRRLNGARVAVSWLAGEFRARLRQGPGRPEVAFHALCDLARSAGAIREASAWALVGEGRTPGRLRRIPR